MSPVTHLLVGWGIANAASLNRRERALVVAAGILPDMDGLGMVAEVLTRDSERPLDWWSQYHHVLCHNIGFGLLVLIGALLFSTRKLMTPSLALVSFHLHLLGDLVGARGPDGYQWPIPYLLPFSDAWQWTWSGQWELNAWPNFLVTGALLGLTFHLAWRRGVSPLEMFSARANEVFVSTLRRRFSRPRDPSLTT